MGKSLDFPNKWRFSGPKATRRSGRPIVVNKLFLDHVHGALSNQEETGSAGHTTQPQIGFCAHIVQVLEQIVYRTVILGDSPFETKKSSRFAEDAADHFFCEY